MDASFPFILGLDVQLFVSRHIAVTGQVKNVAFHFFLSHLGRIAVVRAIACHLKLLHFPIAYLAFQSLLGFGALFLVRAKKHGRSKLVLLFLVGAELLILVVDPLKLRVLPVGRLGHRSG